MKSVKSCVLSINVGSSSVKFALYEIEEILSRLLWGEIESIGIKNTKLSFTNTATNQKNSIDIKAADHDAAIAILMEWLEKQERFASVEAIGHRIVHGMKHTEPEQITPELLVELKAISAYDPEHLPAEIRVVELFGERYPMLLQVACFDTSFHTAMPIVAKLLSIPRRYSAMGIQRYGFHGLSYAYLIEELNRVAGKEIAKGKVIVAHLGNGASLAAIKDGKSIDTSMGFTPTSGLTMGTRTGDLDPGVAWFLMGAEKLSPKQFSHLINHESGLLGISEISSDMRVLLKHQHSDNRAAEAIELFCYQTKKWIGSFAAVLGGLDTLIFSGGIGENTPEIRDRICRGLQFLGIEVDEKRNLKNDEVISIATGRVSIRVIPTNEELMVAKLVCGILLSSVKN